MPQLRPFIYTYRGGFFYIPFSPSLPPPPTGVLVVIICILILLFNVELPNEMKGFIFYAQVIGLVYRPYSVAQAAQNDFDVCVGLFSSWCPDLHKAFPPTYLIPHFHHTTHHTHHTSHITHIPHTYHTHTTHTHTYHTLHTHHPQPLSIILNLLGFSLPIPLCLSSSIRAYYMALFGFITPLLIISCIAAYTIA